jgi:hypothetical protein
MIMISMKVIKNFGGPIKQSTKNSSKTWVKFKEVEEKI